MDGWKTLKYAISLTAVISAAIPQGLCARQNGDGLILKGANPIILQLVDHLSRDTIIKFVRRFEAFGTRYEYSLQRDSAATYIANTMMRLGFNPEVDVYTHCLAEFAGADMVDPRTAYLIGRDTLKRNNLLLRTMDGGISWDTLNPPVATILSAIDFLDSLKGCIVGSSGAVFRTTDGGATWENRLSGTLSQLLDVRFLNEYTGVAVGVQGTLLLTNDGGVSWRTAVWGGTTTLRKCRFAGLQTIMISGDSGVILSSPDAGASWIRMNSGTPTNLNSLDFADSLNGWAVGPMATVIRTTDGGITWLKTSLPSNARRIVGSREQDVVAFSSVAAVVLMEGEIWRTTDGGVTWKRTLGEATHGLRKTSSQGALTYGGPAAVAKTSDLGSTWLAWDFGIPRSLCATSTNCVCTIKGAIHPDREYVITAHYDSPPGNDPGADNNGSGVAVMLEIMRLLNYRTFASTIRFVATSGKETGLLGSNRFASQAKSQFSDIRLVLNLDMLGYPVVGDTTRFILGSYLRRSAFIDSAAVYNTRYGIVARIDTPIDSVRDSDVYPFDVAGYEAVQVSEGTQQEVVLGNPYFLQPADLSDKLNRGMLLMSSQLVLSIVAELAVPVTGGGSGVVPVTGGGSGDGGAWSILSWKIPYDHSSNLNAISLADPHIAFVVGDLGTILKSTNGGVTWSQQIAGTDANLRGICFTDTSHGIAVGDQGTVLRTTDGGKSWKNRAPAGTSTVNFTGVSFSSTSTGTIVGDYGSVYQTFDGGLTWAQEIVSSLMHINAISYSDNSNGVFVGALGSIFGTKDGGLHWHRLVSGLESPTAGQLLAVSFSDANHGTVVGERGKILRTTDGGANWFPQQSGTIFHLRGVQFTDINYGFAFGDQGLILGTKDGGTTWTQKEIGRASWFSGLCFLSTTTGILVGSDSRILRTTDAGTTWNTQAGGPGLDLFGVHVLTSTKSIAVGKEGFIFGTVDGGFTWQKHESGTTNTLRAIDFEDQSNGIAAGDLGTILRTVDGGVSWTGQVFPSDYWFNGVAMKANGLAMVVGRNDSTILLPDTSKLRVLVIRHTAILRSGDEGNTWSELPVPWGKELTAVALGGGIDGNTVVVVGEGGLIARSTNRGTSWNLIAGVFDTIPGVRVLTKKKLNAISLTAPGWVIAVGDSGVVLQSRDAGASWTVRSSGTTNNLKGVGSSNGVDIVAVGAGGTMIGSGDGGASWARISTAATDDLSAVHCLNPQRGMIVGNKGMVLTTTAAGLISFVELPAGQSIPSDFSLSQNYPNPFNSETTIEFTLTRMSPVVVKLFDLLGREIVTLVDELRPQGAYRLRWDARNLPSGVYFCRLSSGGFMATKKMLLLK